MKVRVIGCHGSVEPGYHTTCFWVNERFFIDSGSLCSVLSPAEQEKVTDVLITHPHLDHVKDLCFLIENSAHGEREPLRLHSTKEILDDIHRHLFNDVIWPDFSKISVSENKSKMLLEFHPLPPDLRTEIGGVKIQAFPVNHPGHAVGYLLSDGQVQVLFTGDSGPCAEIWKVANQATQLKALFTEISFPSRLDRLAQVSGHFTLEQLLHDLTHFRSKSVPIYISHFKPMFLRELLDEFHTKASPQLRLLHMNDELAFV